jgi:putative transposase
VAPTCAAFDVSRATFYRRRSAMLGPKPPRPSPPRRLPDVERQAVLAVLHEPRFVDLAPAEVFATLLEEGRYLCSLRTMHRILDENIESRERRNQLRHPSYARPELMAMGPRELWSWDIVRHEAP